ncbi:helix-turn-helix domain-containing protein [Flavobacterium salmonis]|uniref:AraC family transcriptional regulator n=1 Tax=Flavobacterium salmonis TaxID=2654844 RepID=A0A6V6YNB2_9FLAO|nr:helix-turn-helix transcriptional regulator [Flavobacterium salmonis]CAD0000849.1 AraC family transcriptional regulator [Flavobacterium salmonis]
MEHYSTLKELHTAYGFPPPENPLISILFDAERVANFGNHIPEHTCDFYIIALKKMTSGLMKYGYGKTKYDHENGTMFFLNPRQIMEFSDIEQKVEGYLLFIHEDFLNGHSLHQEIKKHGFFEYEVNEALHLSPSEEIIIGELFQKILIEYGNNQDEFSREIMLSHIQSLLKYGSRFYKRQFINRTILSGHTINKFNEVLAGYLKKDALQRQGLPTVKCVASKLNVSPRYLSDLLKQETGKTAIDLIHLSLISEAKNLLKTNNQSVSEIGYALGFENSPYFSKLFKKEVGISPKEYREQFLN